MLSWRLGRIQEKVPKNNGRHDCPMRKWRQTSPSNLFFCPRFEKRDVFRGMQSAGR